MREYKLPTEGVHPATVIDITPKASKNGGKFSILKARLLNENAEATALLFGEAEKQFLASVPGYTGDVLDDLQLLGRSAQVAISHNPDQASGKTYANFDLASVKWEEESSRSPEHEMNPKVVLVVAHHTKGDSKGLAYFRSVGQNQIRTKELFGDSCFAVTTAAFRYLFSSAKEKKVQLRIITDLKPLTQKSELRAEATDARSSLQWQRGVDLKRLLFRGIRTAPVFSSPKPVAGAKAQIDEFDELLG